MHLSRKNVLKDNVQRYVLKHFSLFFISPR